MENDIPRPVDEKSIYLFFAPKLAKSAKK